MFSNVYLVSEEKSRRKFLLATSVAVTGGIAGCSGNNLYNKPENASATGATPTASETSRAELRNRISDLETRLQELEATSQSKSEKINSLEEELSSARSKLESRNEELDSLEKELQEKEQRIQELESQRGQQSDFSDETLSQFRSLAETVRQAVVVIRGSSGGGGTAWFVDSNTLVTNSHVVNGSDSFECFTINGDSFSPTLLGASDYLSRPYHDVAVLETDYTAQTTLSIGDSFQLESDQPVMHVGHPSSIGKWVVSIGRFQGHGFGQAILSSVPSASGNSGSPLVALNGDVVGLTTGSRGQGSGSTGDPQPVELELKEEFEDTTVSTHDTTSTMNNYLDKFR